MLKLLLQAGTLFLPWAIRRRVLGRLFGFNIHPSAKIGFSWIFPENLTMAAGSRINHLTVAVYLDRMILGEKATIGRANWITGYPSRTGSRHFAHQPDRVSALELGNSSAITKNHHFDCTNRLSIGSFTTIAGYGSQFLTHSIDLQASRQDSAPIRIGDYCFVGTDVVVLGGAILPDRSVLGAKSLLQKAFTEPLYLYAGVPAEKKKAISPDAGYFSRTTGFVY